MSELHFDADGEPVKVPVEAEELRVRRFRKPGERGACEVVHGPDGAPLYVPVDISYLEFRKVVEGVPGRYRLDPVDATHRPCTGSVPVYVTIEATRNASGNDDRDGFMRELLRANVEMMRANVEMTRNVTERLATMMTATAEILRAADGAGLPRREPIAETVAEETETEEDEDEDDDEDPANPLAETVAHFLQQAMPLLETYVAERMAARRRAEKTAAAPTAAPSPPPAPPAPMPAPTPASSPSPVAPPTAPEATPTPPTTAEIRNAAPPESPTPEQMQHLFAVKAKLTPQEQQVVMTAIPRMEPAARDHWLGQLCALSVDEAAELVRSMMPPLRTEKEQKS